MKCKISPNQVRFDLLGTDIRNDYFPLMNHSLTGDPPVFIRGENSDIAKRGGYHDLGMCNCTSIKVVVSLPLPGGMNIL